MLLVMSTNITASGTANVDLRANSVHRTLVHQHQCDHGSAGEPAGSTNAVVAIGTTVTASTAATAARPTPFMALQKC